MERVIHFLGGPRAVGAARDAVLDHVSGLPTDILEDLELLVSEVVTNAVRHGGADQRRFIEVRLLEEPDLIRIDVTDEGQGFERHRPIPRHDGGWGLLFVDKLADRWGVERTADRTDVWFEMDIRGNGPRDTRTRAERRFPPMPLSA